MGRLVILGLTFSLLFQGSANAQSYTTPHTAYLAIPSWEYLLPRPDDAEQRGAWDGQPMVCFSGTNALADATPRVPGGVRLETLDLDYCDDHPTLDLNLRLYSFYGQNANPTILGQHSSNGTEGCKSVTINLASQLYSVNNQSRRLLLEFFVTGTNGAGNSCDLRAFGTTLGYRLQISDPPVVPTFNDVPTTDAGFLFIEALAAQGITGGCGDGQFCPDALVTRRQMAILLAKALGLSFP